MRPLVIFFSFLLGLKMASFALRSQKGIGLGKINNNGSIGSDMMIVELFLSGNSVLNLIEFDISHAATVASFVLDDANIYNLATGDKERKELAFPKFERNSADK